jgi:hypothetical protein
MKLFCYAVSFVINPGYLISRSGPVYLITRSGPAYLITRSGTGYLITLPIYV